MTSNGCISALIIYVFLNYFPIQKRSKISLQNLVLRPRAGDFVEAASRLVQVGETQFLGTPRERPRGPAPPRRARLFEQRRVTHVRDRRTIAQRIVEPSRTLDQRCAQVANAPRRSATKPAIAPSSARSHARGKIRFARHNHPRPAAVSSSSARSSRVNRCDAIEHDDQQVRSLRSPDVRARSLPLRSHRRSLTQAGRVDQRERHASISTRSVSRSRVVPGTSVTIARAAPARRLNRLDLPAFGRPTIATCRPSRISRRARRREQQRRDRATIASSACARLARA